MTRIFDALRKVQAAHSAMAPGTPVAPMPPPAAHPAPPPPAVAPVAHARPASPAHTVASPVGPAGFAALPHVETVVPPRLPEEVRRNGVVVQKRSNDILLVIALTSPKGTIPMTAVTDSAFVLNTTSFNFFGSMPPARIACARARWLGPPRATSPNEIDSGSARRRSTRSRMLFSGESCFTLTTE